MQRIITTLSSYLVLALNFCTAQGFMGGNIYTSHLGYVYAAQSSIDNAGNRYTGIYYNENFTIDSIGNPIIINTTADNGVGYPEQSYTLIKYDSSNNYLFHYIIKIYHSRLSETIFNNGLMTIDPDDHIALCLNIRGADSIDLCDSKKNLYRRIRVPREDSSMVVVARLDKNGNYVWANSITSKHYTSPNGSSTPANTLKTFTRNSLGGYLINLDVKPFQRDTFHLIRHIGADTFIYTSRNNLLLEFSETGEFVDSKNPLMLKVNNTADHISVLNSVNYAAYTYDIIKVTLSSRDTIPISSPLSLDSGENYVLIKRDNNENIIWTTLLGRGANAAKFNIDVSPKTGEIIIAFSFINPQFQFPHSVTFPPINNYVLYSARYDQSGMIKSNVIYPSPVFLHGIAYNPKNGGVVMVGKVNGNQLILGQQQINTGTPYYASFAAFLDSSGEVETINLINAVPQIYSVIVGSIDGTASWSIGNPFIDKAGKAYVSGYTGDSIAINCKKYLAPTTYNAFHKHGFVLITNPPKYTIDTSVCYKLIAPSGKYVFDSSGLYTDTIQNVDGCDSIINLNVKVLKSSITIDTVACFMLRSPSGRYTYHENGTYSDTIPNHFGCDSIITIRLIILNTKDSISIATCPPYKSPSNRYTYLTTGIYSDTLINSKGCDSIITISYTSLASHDSISVSTCTAYKSPSLRYTYLTSGVYQDTVANQNGCDSVITINLHVNNTSSNITITSCGIYTIPSGKRSIENNGTYIDTIPNISGCDSIITIDFTNDSIVVEATSSNSISCDTPFTTLHASGANTYSWSPTTHLSSSLDSITLASPIKNTVYYLIGKSASGCIGTDSIQVNVNRFEKIDALPNVFTPNDDGLNDCFFIDPKGDMASGEITIYNRWGLTVFESTNPKACWNGKESSGINSPDGVYEFIFKGISKCGSSVSQHGTLTLIR